METVGMTGASSNGPTPPAPQAHAPRSPAGAVPVGKGGPAVRGEGVSAAPSDAEAMLAFLGAIDFSLGPTLPGGVGTDGLWSGSSADFFLTANQDAPADAFRSLLDAGHNDVHQHDTSGINGLVPWGALGNGGIRMAASANFGSASDYGSGGLGVDEASVEQFSISHPVWGQVDVDSHRSPQSWDVVVRCAQQETQHRLQDREAEFRKLLQREYGVSLTLDVQAGRN